MLMFNEPHLELARMSSVNRTSKGRIFWDKALFTIQHSCLLSWLPLSASCWCSLL